MTEFEQFLDISYETDEELKSDEAKKREQESLQVGKKRKPLPHEVARGARIPWPHELLEDH